jgi:hypothetical protein
MQNTYDILIKNRQYLLQLIEPYSFEQLNFVPKTFSNSIIWNFGHLMVTEKTLTYGLSNLEIPIVTVQEIEMFRKGTFPITYQKELWNEIKSNFILSLNRTVADYQKGFFHSFTPYTTSIGVNLSDLETTAQYILYHEGIHAGVIQSIRKQF